jgi:hypothetical protein
MEDAAIYSSLLLNVIYAVSFLVALMTRVQKKAFPESSAKAIYATAVIVVGLLCGIAAYPGFVYLYEWAGMPQDEGHGEVLIAALILNFILACVLAAAGRAVLGWKPMQW